MRFDDYPLAVIIKMRIRSETRADSSRGPKIHSPQMFWKRGVIKSDVRPEISQLALANPHSIIYRIEEQNGPGQGQMPTPPCLEEQNVTEEFLALSLDNVLALDPTHPDTHPPDQHFARCPELKSALKQWHQQAGGDPSAAEGVQNRDGAQTVYEVDGQLDETATGPRGAAALKTNRDRFRRGNRAGRNWRPAALSGGSAMRWGSVQARLRSSGPRDGRVDAVS